MQASYLHSGWQADNAMLKALECVTNTSDLQVVTTAIKSVYEPWLDDAARHLQQVVEQNGYPGGTLTSRSTQPAQHGDCFLFVDGLRFDIAKRLSTLLTDNNLLVEEQLCWAPLPSVTATGKPAVSPVNEFIAGGEDTADFEPCVKESGQSLKGGYHFKKLLSGSGIQVLEKTDYGNGEGIGWYEYGDVDHEGHERGWKVAKQIDIFLQELHETIEQLFSSGWKSIRIVTDHGWLLLPGGLPKLDLPKSLVENKWGRCAVLKEGAASHEKLYPWFWNPEQNIALANGISCYKSGEEYAHGGLSLQECLGLQMHITKEPIATQGEVQITDVVWKGLRCKVAVDGLFAGLQLDVRSQAGNESSSIVMSIKAIDSNGVASVVLCKYR
ncbi:MAG: BREX-1 system phosphatase PglZ type B [Desulfobulbaceae bacterium]|nr:BREX-1 system phosphatase PglZ type B [Desulfobulbaceae bacterium]